MTYEEFLSLCAFYKGEEDRPKKFAGTDDGKLWVAERHACKGFLNRCFIWEKYSENPRKYLAHFVFAYVCKWDPYEWEQTMNRYLEKVSDLKQLLKD